MALCGVPRMAKIKNYLFYWGPALLTGQCQLQMYITIDTKLMLKSRIRNNS